MGAIDPVTEKITSLGESMVHYPVGVRFAKTLVLAKQTSSLLPYVISIIAGMSVRSIYVRPEELIMRFTSGKNVIEEENEKKENEEYDQTELEEKKKGLTEFQLEGI